MRTSLLCSLRQRNDGEIAEMSKQQRSNTIKILIALSLIATGSAFLALGRFENLRVTYESFDEPRPMMIYADGETEIYDMRIVVGCAEESLPWQLIYEGWEELLSRGDGWARALIWLNQSSRLVNLTFLLPYEIDRVQSTCASFSYNESYDVSILKLSYDQTYDYSQVTFDWKIPKKISYDQERVAIAFERPSAAAKSWFKYSPILKESLGPEVEKLIIQIEGNHPLDFSCTYPQPSYHYFLEEATSAYWTFDSKREISSVQAVFRDPILSKEKSNILFLSSVYTAGGISAIFLGIKETLEILKELYIRRSKNLRKKRTGTRSAKVARAQKKEGS